MAALLVLWAALITSVLHCVTAHREHKVHNIVLYPDKYSWCNITPIKQVVAYPDCTSVEIDNNVCVGTCFSYSIPLTLPSAPGEIIHPYCDSCQPSSVVWQNFTLTCQEKTMEKTVQIIQNCSCHSCHQEVDPDREPPAVVDGSAALRWIAENDEEVDKNEEQTDESIKKVMLIEPEGKYLLTDKEAIVNFFQSNPATTTEQKLQFLCRHIKEKETTKVDDIKQNILKLEKEIMKINQHAGNPATRHHHHGHHHQQHEVVEDKTEHSPTLNLSPGQMTPAQGGQELTYIPSAGQEEPAD